MTLRILKIYKKILFRFVKNAIFSPRRIRRDESFVTGEYSKSWSQNPSAIIMGKKLRRYSINDRPAYCRLGEFRKLLVSQIHHTVASLRPLTVLELGSGIGQNIICLAILNPDVKRFVGVEMTEEGVAMARKMLAEPPMTDLVYLTEQSEDVIRKHLKKTSIEFVQGNIRKLAFKDNEFDFSFSCQVFEQIPRYYLESFREVARVTSKNAFFLEEFRESQKNIFQLMHLWNMDYFRWSFHEVEKAGFQVIRFETLPVANEILSIGALLAEKNQSKERGVNF